MEDNGKKNYFQKLYFSDNIRTRITAYLVTVVIVLLAATLILTFLFSSKSDGEEEYIPSPIEIYYGIAELEEKGCELSNIEAYISSESGYFGYSMKTDYSMIYQIRNEEEKSAAEDYLLIDGGLPETDYSKNYLLISIGRKIDDINKNLSTTDEKTGEIIAYITYEKEYYADTAFIYSMNCVNFMNGSSLDYYLWRTVSENSNIIEIQTEERKLSSYGKYFKEYSYSDNKTEFVLLDKAGNVVEREMIEGTPAQITEYSSTMVKIDLGDKNYYFNAETGKVSYYYEFKTEFFRYNIISYMREHNGELQLILRDAYDETRYAKIIRLDFSDDMENIDMLVQKIVYIDKYTVSVTYVKGRDHSIVTENVSVYNMNRY